MCVCVCGGGGVHNTRKTHWACRDDELFRRRPERVGSQRLEALCTSSICRVRNIYPWLVNAEVAMGTAERRGPSSSEEISQRSKWLLKEEGAMESVA